MDKRRHMGKDKDGVIFPVAPNLSEMSDSYLEFMFMHMIHSHKKTVWAKFAHTGI